MTTTHDAVYARFMSKVDISAGATGCWLWTGRRNKRGYGRFDADGRSHIASRWLLGHLRGKPLEQAEFACHRCDNPPCVNPAHLYVGSPKDNFHDYLARGPKRPLKATCKNRHPFTPENTRIARYKGRTYRICLRCTRRAGREHAARKRAGRAP